MNKRELFIKAMKAGLYKKLEWVVSAFSISQETDSVFAYKIKTDPTGHYYLDPNTLKDWIKIDDAQAGVPVFMPKEEGLLKVEKERYLTIIEITLTKTPTAEQKKSPGYEPPIKTDQADLLTKEKWQEREN